MISGKPTTHYDLVPKYWHVPETKKSDFVDFRETFYVIGYEVAMVTDEQYAGAYYITCNNDNKIEVHVNVALSLSIYYKRLV